MIPYNDTMILVRLDKYHDVDLDRQMKEINGMHLFRSTVP
jgi:hypothetical protein